MTDHEVEQEIIAKGLTAARLTPADIAAKVANVFFYVFPGTTLTVCCLVLENGFCVVGESACASPENFNRELGEEIALNDARRKIWALEGYALRGRLCEEARAFSVRRRSLLGRIARAPATWRAHRDLGLTVVASLRLVASLIRGVRND